jgi:hypothetical protein
VKAFPTFYGIQRFVTVLTRSRQLHLSWARSIQYTPPSYFGSILTLSSHLCPGLPSAVFPSRFTTKTLYAPSLCPIHATCSAHFTLLDKYPVRKSWSPSLCRLLQSPVTSFHLGLYIFFISPFSNMLSTCSSLKVTDQVWHPYKTTGIRIVLHILIFIFVDKNYIRSSNEWQ